MLLKKMQLIQIDSILTNVRGQFMTLNAVILNVRRVSAGDFARYDFSSLINYSNGHVYQIKCYTKYGIRTIVAHSSKIKVLNACG